MTSTSNAATGTSQPVMVTLAEVAELFRTRDNFLIVSHLRPDGDCLGSATALLMVLRSLGKRVAAYNATAVPTKYQFLPAIEEVRAEMPPWQVDTTVFVDCGGVTRVARDFAPVGFTVNIDHHATNDCFGDVNYVDISACAVGEQVYRIAGELGVELTRDMAVSIYTSVMTDTGGFRFSNTGAGTFELAADLCRRGVVPDDIAQAVYESRRREEVGLIGAAFERIRYGAGGALATSELRWPDYAEAGGEDAEPEGLAGEIRSIDGVEVAILFHELEQGGIRAALRGKGLVDCAALAESFGGGGHRNAAGCYIPGVDYEQKREEITAATARAILAAQGGA